MIRRELTEYDGRDGGCWVELAGTSAVCRSARGADLLRRCTNLTFRPFACNLVGKSMEAHRSQDGAIAM